VRVKARGRGRRTWEGLTSACEVRGGGGSSVGLLKWGECRVEGVRRGGEAG